MGTKDYLSWKILDATISQTGDSAVLCNRINQKRKKNPHVKLNCNLCNKGFMAKNKFERFCKKCKEENEFYLSFDEL